MSQSYTSAACRTLSTHRHRYCTAKDCECLCHEMMAQVNYEKNDARRVKRVG